MLVVLHLRPAACHCISALQLGTLGTLTVQQVGDGLSKEEVITIKVSQQAGDMGGREERGAGPAAV